MFKGALVAIVTPFKNGAVDEVAFRKLIEFQIASSPTESFHAGRPVNQQL